MSTAEVKNTLAARRPDGRDDADPLIAAALAATRQDRKLAAWAERARADDTRIAHALRSVTPPVGLREVILSHRPDREASVPVRPRSAWRFIRAQALPIAASLALIAAWATWRFVPRPTSTPDLASLTAAVRSEYGAPTHTAPTIMGGRGELAARLAAPVLRLGTGLDLDFAQLRAGGCRTVSIAGIEVLEVCFMRGASDELHLYIAHLDAVRPGAIHAAPVVALLQGLTSATWTDAKHAYVLVASLDEATLRALL